MGSYENNDSSEKITSFMKTMQTIIKKITSSLVCELSKRECAKLQEEFESMNNDGTENEKQAINFGIIESYICKKNKKAKDEIKRFCQQITPLFLFSLIELPNKKLMNELICNMKLEVYDRKEAISDLISKMNESLKSSNTQNVFSSGDIFYKRDEGDDKFFMNIVPSCQMFRPKKVDKKFLFITGKIVKKECEKERIRDSEFLLYLPNPDDREDILCVKWSFHDIRQVDLEGQEYKDADFSQYERPYRLVDNYYRQLLSKMNAYNSKVGVDDLFIDNSLLVGNLFQNADFRTT